MAFALCCTTLLQTGASAVSAAEVGGVSAQSETQIEVQTETQTETQTEKSEEELIEETVADPELALMVTEGEAFDIQNDFTGLKLYDGDHVELKKAAMEDGTVFDYNHAGTYKCVYLVTHASGEDVYKRQGSYPAREDLLYRKFSNQIVERTGQD